jgi:hypothetical protein
VPTRAGTLVRPRRARRARARAALAGLAVAGILVAGCSASAGSSATDAQAGPGSAGGLSQGGGGSAAAGSAATAGAAAPSGSERQVVRNGELYLTVADPLAAADRVAQIADRVGGRVDERQQEAGTDGSAGSATMTIRVPSGSLDDTVAELHGLGDVTRYTEKAQDVTGTVVDLDARISAAQTSVQRVQGFLEHASSTTELLATEQALSQRQTELEQLRGQRATLGDQVAMSTLSVSLTAPGHPAIETAGPRSFAGGVGVGWRSLLAALRGASVLLGVLLPWLVLGAIVTAAFVVPLRWRRRRSPATAPAPLPAGARFPGGPIVGPPVAGTPFVGPAVSGPPVGGAPVVEPTPGPPPSGRPRPDGPPAAPPAPRP